MSDRIGELLALLTAGNSWDLSSSGGPATRRTRMQPQDVAAALAKVRPREVADLLLVLYCGHPVADLAERLTPLLARSCSISLPQHLRDRLPELVALAFVDLQAPLVCPSCQGRGWVRDRRECQSCGGTGQLTRQRGVFLARSFGVSKSTWSECWSWRYQSVFQALSQLVAEGLFQLQTALGYCSEYK